jgi:hypothetical protein
MLDRERPALGTLARHRASVGRLPTTSGRGRLDVSGPVSRAITSTCLRCARWVAQLSPGVGLAPFFAKSKLPCTELEWCGETRVGNVTIRFVPSQHWSRRGLNDGNATLWGGFVIEASTARLYHSGDTAYFVAMHFGTFKLTDEPLDAAHDARLVCGVC